MPVYRLEDGSGLIPALAGIQRQTVLRFATAAERTQKLPHPDRLMVTALESTNGFDYWNGAAWVPFGGDAALAGRVTALEARAPVVNRVLLTATSVAGTAVTQATVDLAAKPYARTVAAMFHSCGFTTGDNGSLWAFSIVAAGVVEANTVWQARDPISASATTVAAGAVLALAADTTLRVEALVTRVSGASSTWVYSQNTLLRYNRLEVAAF